MTDWLTVPEAAAYVKISHDLIRAAVKDGDLPAYRVGRGHRDYRLTADDIDEWMRGRSYEPKASA